jgi:hypothetical protein
LLFTHSLAKTEEMGIGLKGKVKTHKTLVPKALCCSTKEAIDVLELGFQQSLSIIKTEATKDAKTIMLLQYAQINQLTAL